MKKNTHNLSYEEKKQNFSNSVFDSKILISDTFVSNSDIAQVVGLSNRAIRNEIKEISMFYAVLFNSKTKGHRLAKKFEDFTCLEELIDELYEVDKTIKDINSRIKQLKRKLKPLIAYKKVMQNFLTSMDKSLGTDYIKQTNKTKKEELK